MTDEELDEATFNDDHHGAVPTIPEPVLGQLVSEAQGQGMGDE